MNQIEMWPIERLKPYVKNPRKHDHKVNAMADMIKEYGFRIPLIVNGSSGELVDGHMRLKAAIKLGLKEVPVTDAQDLTEDQIKAFRILVNKSATWASWDTEMLKVELGELQQVEFDLNLTGFENFEIQGLDLASLNQPVTAAPPPQAAPDTLSQPPPSQGIENQENGSKETLAPSNEISTENPPQTSTEAPPDDLYTNIQQPEISEDDDEELPDMEDEGEDFSNKLSSSQAVKSEVLIFDNNRVPMSDEEFQMLRDDFKKYTADCGTTFGWVGSLIRRANR